MFYIGQEIICIKDVVDQVGNIYAHKDEIFRIIDIKVCKCKDHVFLFLGHTYTPSVNTNCNKCLYPLTKKENRLFLTSIAFAPLEKSKNTFADEIEKKIFKEYEMFETNV